jgi:predicted nucleic-acid-binding protein
LFAKDDLAQFTRSSAVLRAAWDEGQRVYVSLAVILEMCWVLRSTFGFSRNEVLDCLGDLSDR